MSGQISAEQKISLLRAALEMQTADRHERLTHDGATYVECSNPVCSNVVWVLRRTEIDQ
jgi:hypothetical protein